MAFLGYHMSKEDFDDQCHFDNAYPDENQQEAPCPVYTQIPWPKDDHHDPIVEQHSHASQDAQLLNPASRSHGDTHHQFLDYGPMRNYRAALTQDSVGNVSEQFWPDDHAEQSGCETVSLREIEGSVEGTRFFPVSERAVHDGFLDEQSEIISALAFGSFSQVDQHEQESGVHDRIDGLRYLYDVNAYTYPGNDLAIRASEYLTLSVPDIDPPLQPGSYYGYPLTPSDSLTGQIDTEPTFRSRNFDAGLSFDYEGPEAFEPSQLPSPESSTKHQHRKRLPSSAPRSRPSVTSHDEDSSLLQGEQPLTPSIPSRQLEDTSEQRRHYERAGQRPDRRRSRRQSTLMWDESPEALIDEARLAQDKYLVEQRELGMSYKEIKVLGNFPEAVSTLRGRYRTLTKEREERVRKPEWQPEDIRLLHEAVDHVFSEGESRDAKVPWTKVSTYIAENGGSYRFGNATCHKKWMEQQQQQRRRRR